MLARKKQVIDVVEYERVSEKNSSSELDERLCAILAAILRLEKVIKLLSAKIICRENSFFVIVL
jgi:hypothetical protein